MIALDPGLGKSVTTLTAIADLYTTFEIAKVLVIAPKRVAHHTWPAEIKAWDHLGELSYTLIEGTPAERRAALAAKDPVHIINRELVPWLVDTLGAPGAGPAWAYDMVVIDESTSFKNVRSKRFKALRKVIPTIPRVVCLTGTPAPNGLLDIFGQCWLLDQGKRLGKTFSQYRARYFTPDHMAWNWTLKPGAEEKIHGKIADLCLRMSAADYLELPDRIDHTIEVELPEDAWQFYRTLEKEFVLAMSELALADGDLPVLNAAAQVNKMLQVANGAVYTDEARATGAYPSGAPRYQVLHDAKLDALESIIEECAGAPVLVAYTYQSDLDRIRRRFSTRHRPVVDIRDHGAKGQPSAIERWNRGQIQLLAAHPASAGHGLNLQHGGNHIVWFGLPWSLELYQQFNARLHRQGQDKPVFVYHIQAAGTVDQDVRAALDRKDTTQTALLEALKEKLVGGVGEGVAA